MTDKAEATADKLVMTILELERTALALQNPESNYELREAAARRAEYAAKEARAFMARNYEWAFYMERA
jgi:hypothetical protein